MRLTTKGRFAVTAMLDLAIYQKENVPVSLSDISERQNISLSYLEQLFGKLRRCGLVISFRGPGGGYFLSKPAKEISVSDIIAAVDDMLDATQCQGKGNCHHNSPCMTHQLWENLNDTILQYLSAVSLDTLIDMQPKQTEQPITVKKNNIKHHLEVQP
ncbi:Fe-S cluster assembly transcription factor [Neisseria sp. Ec49-e6-T10]|uniref:Fe-S cluster assembly transcription factor n=1 Tax=Neisseria sp. Ec49-e6-T10 TaxID=3140744 RepID=UPI003EB6B0EB